MLNFFRLRCVFETTADLLNNQTQKPEDHRSIAVFWLFVRVDRLI